MYKKKDLVLSLDNVSLTIPVFSKTELSLKKSFYRAVTGTKISSSKKLSSVEALNCVSLDIYRGDKIGLIGHNGSGKSTFIRLVSNIYYPTSGKIFRKIQPYPMLSPSFIVQEVLTGIDSAKAHYLFRYQNLNGFENYLDDVVEFSGLGDFIALPIRTYSAGMKSRLMFSLLTFDKHEFLAVKDFIGGSGTLILASHSDSLLKLFCKRGLVFSGGNIVYDGKLEDALKFYAQVNK